MGKESIDANDIVAKLFSHLEEVLRYIAPGFVALFIIALMYNPFSFADEKFPVWAIVTIAALSGFIIYGVSTSVFNRICWWVITFLYCCVFHKGDISEAEKHKSIIASMFELDTQRWLRRASEEPQVRSIQAQIDKWSAMLNFLYSTSYLMILLPLCLHGLLQYSDEPCLVNKWFLITLLGLFILICALISEYGMTKREFWAKTVYPNGKQANTN